MLQKQRMSWLLVDTEEGKKSTTDWIVHDWHSQYKDKDWGWEDKIGCSWSFCVGGPHLSWVYRSGEAIPHQIWSWGRSLFVIYSWRDGKVTGVTIRHREGRSIGFLREKGINLILKGVEKAVLVTKLTSSQRRWKGCTCGLCKKGGVGQHVCQPRLEDARPDCMAVKEQLKLWWGRGSKMRTLQKKKNPLK